MRCISFDSYIKPQRVNPTISSPPVVYLLTPTSNHNYSSRESPSCSLYIFWLLHQTTTRVRLRPVPLRCISFDSYIKPQLKSALRRRDNCCISFDSYIKPQLFGVFFCFLGVVYLLTPTSNHNWMPARTYRQTLYIFWLLHQTTTVLITDGTTPTLYIFWLLHQTTTYIVVFPESETLYIFWLLHQTTTDKTLLLEGIWLYIFWLLHQTTTRNLLWTNFNCCISFDSYIKPQRCGRQPLAERGCISFDSYIKPQLWFPKLSINEGCISFDSYIKPQPFVSFKFIVYVVYLLTPTSNHNGPFGLALGRGVVYLLTPTSNHNLQIAHLCIAHVVYLLTPTSNHNMINAV